jgi:hypothetical protein
MEQFIAVDEEPAVEIRVDERGLAPVIQIRQLIAEEGAKCRDK